jgi:hypothetical protein
MQTVQVPGFEGRRIEVEVSNGFNSSRLLVNGQPAPAAPRRGLFLLRRDDGREVTAQFKAGFPDPIPALLVDNQTIRLAEPLAWYEIVWIAFPLVLIFIGGAIGGALGGGATVINAQIMRSQQNTVAKYALCALVSLAAFGLREFIVSLIRR